MDKETQVVLAHAELEVMKYIFGKPVDKVVSGLTDPAIRHHVQTILDLTPTKL